MASATAPPTPVSISSKTSVGAEPRSASTTLSASRKRASSPPEATFISGPGRVPGLVCTQNSTRSMPFGPAASASLTISVEKRARSSLSGLSSALTALSSAVAALSRAFDSASAALRNALSACGGGRFQRLQLLLAGIDQADVVAIALRQRREIVDRHVVFAAGGAQREQPLLDALELGRIVIGGAQGGFEMGAGLFQRVERGVERLHRRLDQLRRLGAAALEPADGGGKRRHAEFEPASTSWASRRSSATFSACIMVVRRSASAVSSPACGASLSSSSTAWRSQSPSRLARSTSRGMRLGRFQRVAARGPQGLDAGGVGLQPAKGVEQPAMRGGIDQRAVVVLAVDLDQRLAELPEHAAR